MSKRKDKKNVFRIISKWFEDHMTPVIVVFSISTVVIFTVADMIMAAHSINLSDTLIEWVYKFFGLEMLALSGIKISKHVGSAFGKVESKVDGQEDYNNEE